ncbi:phage holin family protein [Peptoniphilus sp. EMRHCC_23]|nr:phage holin family protein [Peptoniphilus rachelemmaiella]
MICTIFTGQTSKEGIFILESSVALGLPIPEKLKDILKQFKEEK